MPSQSQPGDGSSATVDAAPQDSPCALQQPDAVGADSDGRAAHALWVVLAGFGGRGRDVGGLAEGQDRHDEGREGDVAPITGVIGAIVGAYFGVHVGQSGKAEAEAARVVAENQAKGLAAVGEPEATARVLGLPALEQGGQERPPASAG